MRSGAVLLENIVSVWIFSLHPGDEVVFQELLVDVGGDFHVLINEDDQALLPVAGEDSKDHDLGRVLGLVHQPNIWIILQPLLFVREISACLLVENLVNNEQFFITEDPDQLGVGLVLDPVQQASCSLQALVCTPCNKQNVLNFQRFIFQVFFDKSLPTSVADLDVPGDAGNVGLGGLLNELVGLPYDCFCPCTSRPARSLPCGE